MATGSDMNYCDKYCKKFRAKNINNYEIHTNHKAVKRPDGRRYYVVDINTKYCNDHEYFKDLRDTCFNEEVGYAFYNYLMEIDTDDYNSLDMPDTQAKLNMIVDLLNPIEKFLKKEYLLKKKNVRSKVKDLYTEYEIFCTENGLHCETKTEFTSGLKQYGFEFKCIGGYNCYRISVELLQAVAEKRKWLHELDKDDMDEEDLNHDNDEEDDGVDTSDKSVDLAVEYTKLLHRYNALLKQTKTETKAKARNPRKFGIVYEEDYDDDAEEVTIITKRKSKR